MVITHRCWPWPEDSIFLFGKDAQSILHGAQALIQVYPLPEGTEKFHEGLSLYLEQKKGFLVEGSRFDTSFLLPRSVAAVFERQSFQTRDGTHRRRIVHLFSSPRRAIILVYSLSSADFASSLFFRQVSESLNIGK